MYVLCDVMRLKLMFWYEMRHDLVGWPYIGMRL